MLNRIVVTLGLILLIGADAAPSANPHTISIVSSHVMHLDDAHVELGIAVLGPHVSRIDGGWLVKQKSSGWLHIDWSRGGTWGGLTRTEIGPRDVTEAQLQSVVATIERMGYPASAIRAWRVVAPVGWDEYHENDRTLWIGEILVDLGTGDQARDALAHWLNTIEGHDPFDKLDGIRVSYVDTPFLQPDCAAYSRTLHAAALADSMEILRAIAASAHTAAAFTDEAAAFPSQVLCPETIRPNIARTSIPPLTLDNYFFSMWQFVTEQYTIAGTSNERFVPPVADDLTTADAFSLNEPYVASTAEDDVSTTPDAVVLEFEYGLGLSTAPDFDANKQRAEEHIALMRALVADPKRVLVREPDARHVSSVRAYVLLHAADLPLVPRIAAAARLADFEPSGSYMVFMPDCARALRASVAASLAETRRQADIVARLLHARVAGLGAVRVDPYGAQGHECGSAANESLDALAQRMTLDARSNLPYNNEIANIAIGPKVHAAWLLAGITSPHAPLVRAQYSASVLGDATTPYATLDRQALAQAVVQASVDRGGIISIEEADPFESTTPDNRREATATIVVLRRP